MAYLLQQLLTDGEERHPERVAVNCKDQRLTYAELEAISGRLAGAAGARSRSGGSRWPLFAEVDRIRGGHFRHPSRRRRPMSLWTRRPPSSASPTSWAIATIKALVSTAKKIDQLGPALPTPCPLQFVVPPTTQSDPRKLPAHV